MQRCFFLLIFFLSLNTSFSQALDTKAIEFSLWYENEAGNKLHARSLVTINRHDHSSIRLNFHPQSVQYIRLREGRLKQDLKFSQSKDFITIDVPISKGAIVQIEFDYLINLEAEFYQGIVNREEVPLSFNLQNLFLHKSLGLAGSFFPALPKDAFLFSANITLPKSINSGTLGELEFEVDHKSDVRSQFWRSSEEIMVEDFYLIIGEFKNFDEEDFEDDYEFEAIDLKDFLVREARAEISDVLAFIQQWDSNNPVNSLNDDEVLELDSIGKLTNAFLWVKKEDALGNWSKHLFEKEQLLFLKALEGDTLRASFLHFQYLSQIEGPNWSLKYLESKWNSLNVQSDSANTDRYVMHSRILDWLSESDPNAWNTFIKKDSANMQGERWKLARAILEANVMPKVKFNYNYRDEQEHVFIEQDSTQMSPVSIPFKITLFSRDSSKTFESHSSKVFNDTLAFPQKGAPQAVLLEFEPKLPAYIETPRSDLYDLYLFSNAPNAELRKQALNRLFETKNKNLFSTVLGIAMDSKDSDLRLEALKRSDELDVPAQIKLKQTIIQLSENDPLPEVRIAAKQLVVKYYPNK